MVETAVAPRSGETATKAVKVLLMREIPLDQTARFMLGRFWPTDNNEAGRRFQAEFRDFLAEALTQGLRANPGLTLEIKASHDRTDGSTLVVSQLRLPSDMTLPVDWRVVRDPADGAFRITDIAISGIDAAVALRSMAEATLADTDLDGLIPRWRTALARRTADHADAPR
jgi:ABC-type transporter MlaC component